MHLFCFDTRSSKRKKEMKMNNSLMWVSTFKIKHLEGTGELTKQGQDHPAERQ